MADDKPELDELPDALIDALRHADRAPPLITTSVDRQVSQAARAQFRSREPVPRWQLPATGAVAAGLLIAALVAMFETPSISDTVPVYADVDQSGRIDIADVMAYARKSGSEPGAEARIRSFAARIVSLNPRSDT